MEKLRYLRFERQVLHRDSSTGNMVYINDNTPSAPIQAVRSVPTLDAGPSGDADTKEVSLCFIQYLLGKRYVRNTVIRRLLKWD